MLLYSDLPSGLPTEMLIFGLLTFAPRKNPPDGGNLTLLRYHVTAFITILYFSRVCKHFFTFFYFFLKHSFKRNKMLCYRHFEKQRIFSICVSSYYNIEKNRAVRDPALRSTLPLAFRSVSQSVCPTQCHRS